MAGSVSGFGSRVRHGGQQRGKRRLCAHLALPAPPLQAAGIVPMPAALMGVLWLLRDVSGAFEGGSHITHAGHLGGAVTGLAFFLLFK